MYRFSTALAALLLATTAHADPVTVDNCGEPLTFETMPERMVTQDINIAEMAFSLGLQDRMVGVSGISGWYKATPYFEEQRGDLPEIAPKYPSMENLIASGADLFFGGWYYGMKPGGDVTPETLGLQGIKTLLLTESCIHVHKDRPAASLDLLYGDIERLGRIFDREDRAGELVDGWKARVAAVRKAVEGSRTAPRVPVRFRRGQALYRRRYAMPTAMIEAAGGRNVTADMETSWGTTSWEAVAAADPEFILLVDYHASGGADKLLAFLRAHPVLGHLKAVKENRTLPLRYEELTPGPANIDGVEKIARALYPDAF